VNKMCSKISSLICVLATACVGISPVFANSYDNEWENVEENSERSEEQDAKASALEKQQDEEAEEIQEASGKQVRRFHEVLDELLAEFGYDVRMGQLKGLKNVSIRRVDVSDALPDTYRTYVEMLVAERIRENSRVKLVSCIPCRSKTSHLVDGKLMITSPTTNMQTMRDAADQLGVDYFMDVVMVYHTTHMVLAMEVFHVATQELVWTRTYNSETVKSRYQKLAVDYEQVEKSRPGEEYSPEYRYLLGFGGGVIPNVNNSSEDNGMLAILIRGTEKFDNRRHEFGLQLNTYIRKNSILNDHGTAASDSSSTGSTALAESDTTASKLKPWSFAIAMYGVYGRHFVGSLESYNKIRHGLNAGLGFLLAPAYMTPSLRFGWDIYFGKRFVTNFGLVAIGPSSVIVKSKSVKTKAGVGGDLAISVNF
jgi:hypothetical protein